MNKQQVIKAIRNLPVNHTAHTFKEADEWCQKHPEHSPHIVIITNLKAQVL